MIIEIKKISELTPAPYNPRESTEKQESQLKQSLKKFGVVEPIIYNKQTGYIVGGHFRVRELQKLGYTEIECVIVDLAEEDEKELNIRLNANTGQWDWDELANNFELEDLNDWGLEVPNMKHELEAEEDDFDVPVDGIETDIVLGDLFEIGEHRLLCGDSTDSDAVARLMDGQKADMVFTDPPYGINEEGDRSKRGGLAKGNNLPSFKDDTIQYAIDAFNQSINQDIKIQVWFGANYYCHSLPQSPNWLVWDKRVEENQRDYNSDCELAWIKSDKKSIRIFRHLWKGMLKDSERGEKRVHATQKPIALVDYCINEYAPKANLILDYFLGSGVCMVASHQLKRKCYGMELDPKYCQVIIDRMKRLDPTIKIKRNGVEL